jgi:hypothetical protein
MSYDMESLHAKGAVAIASVKFATSSDIAGLTLIAAAAGAAPVIHQISFAASSWANIQFGRATAAASSYWNAYAGQTPITEPTRIICDASANVYADLASVAVVTGNGFIRAWYTMQKGAGVAVGSL